MVNKRNAYSAAELQFLTKIDFKCFKNFVHDSSLNLHPEFQHTNP